MFTKSKAELIVSLVVALYLALAVSVKAHSVEQFYSSYEDGSGALVVNFDVAYAMPEVRDVENAPQPLREWLVKLTDEQHKILRAEAELYLRNYIQFELGGHVIDFHVEFPDFKSRPYPFPKLLNAGAYYNIRLVPVIDSGSDIGAEIVVRVKDGKFPNLVVAHEVEGQLNFETIQPSNLLDLKRFRSRVEIERKLDKPIEVDKEVRFSKWQLLVLGFRHVIPNGLDHILFIIGMCLVAGGVRPLLWQSIVFTVAHSLSMVLVVSEWLPIYTYAISGYIEAIIALSITFIAVECLVMKTDFKWRCVVILIFGFVHGLGFAGSLGSTLQFLSADGWVVPLILANIGIEVAQALLVIGCFSLLVYLKKVQSNQLDRIIRPLTAISIACVGLIWFFQRLP